MDNFCKHEAAFKYANKRVYENGLIDSGRLNDYNTIYSEIIKSFEAGIEWREEQKNKIMIIKKRRYFKVNSNICITEVRVFGILVYRNIDEIKAFEMAAK